jgi:hypothetical protein
MVLRKIALLIGCSAFLACSSPADGDDATDTTDEALAKDHVTRISTISYAPNSFVIGNAYPNWTDDVQGDPQFARGPGNPNGAAYRWGYLFGENFDHCAWINNRDLSPGAHAKGSRCGSPQEIDTAHFAATYTNGDRNDLVSDGSATHMQYNGAGCVDKNAYGNVAPWRVPATPANKVGQVPNGKVLRWRYVSKDGHWVLVRDPNPPANQPNWYFVQRGCVSLANRN